MGVPINCIISYIKLIWLHIYMTILGEDLHLYIGVLCVLSLAYTLCRSVQVSTFTYYVVGPIIQANLK